MKRSVRLTVVVEMAKRKEEEAALRLADCGRELACEEQRLGELDEYYREYEVSFNNMRSGICAASLASNREFLRQLSESRSLQTLQIKQKRDQFEIAKNYWHQCHLKHDKIKSFVADIAREEQWRQLRLEQKNADEWAMLAHSRR